MAHLTGSINILIVEDNEGDVVLLTEVLQSTTLEISNLFYAKDLAKTFEIISNHTIDLILLDLTLPDSKGLASFLDLQRFRQHIPVIILTGIADTNLALDAINSGAQDYLVKGDVDEKLLQKTILYSIERKRISESLRLSNERYNLVSKATNDMVWDWDVVNNTVFRNAGGWEKMFGEKPSNATLNVDAWKERLHPDDKEMVNATVAGIIENNSLNHFEIEYRARLEEGSYIHVIDRGYVIRNEQGKAIRLIGAIQNVTEKKLAEEELKKLSLIAKETLNSVIITDIEGKITWVNEAFTNIAGYTPQEVMGRSPGEVLQGPETNPVTRRYMRKMIHKQKSFECDIINYTKQGKKYWIRIQCQPQFDEKGMPINFFAIQTDITREKEAEQNLINSERKFRALIENSKDGMSVISEEGIVLDISVSGLKMLGYTKEAYVGLERKKLIHPADQAIVDDSFREVIEHPRSVRTIEYRFKKANGEYTWLESTFHNLLEEPSINAIVIHYREINERKLAVDLVKSSEEKYRNLFNNNPASIFIWNPEDLAILEINDAAIKEYGYTREEFLQMSVTDLNAAGSGEEIRDLAQNLMINENFKSNAIWQHETKSGAGRYMDITFQAIDYYGQKASLAIVNNITGQIELEIKLSTERLKKQQEITAAVITAQEQEREELGKELHDNINQILATTRLYIEYAQTNEAMREQLLQSAKEFIMSAVTEIRNLSKSLLPPSLGEVGLVVALEELFDTIRRVNKYAFHTEWIDIDEKRVPEQLKLTIFRIIQEQINNIIKHAQANNIWVKIKMQNQRLLISVKDDGKGFNMIEKSKGVGLKNISSRAGLHNGTMQMQSEPGEGCELKVAFSL
jgi:PAS domain S-box-containing protein